MSAIIAAFPQSVSAASSDTWKADYAQGVPTIPGMNKTATCKVSYNSDGFYAICDKIEGSVDMAVYITSSMAGGIDNTNKRVEMHRAGRTPFKTKYSISDDVTFKVEAMGNQCCANGSITIKN